MMSMTYQLAQIHHDEILVEPRLPHPQLSAP